MTQAAYSIDMFTFFGDENPNGWFVGQNGVTYADTIANIIYLWNGGTSWTPISRFDGNYNSLTNKPKLTLTNPVSRTIAKSTAYQAIDNTKPAVITVTLTSTSSVSLTGSVSNAANILIGTNNAVASGTGTIVGKYNNVLGGTLIVGLNLTNTQTCSYTINLPIGGYFSIIQTTGSGVTIDSVVEQVLNLA